MQINYNVTGSERKRLAMSIAEITGSEVKYKGAPTFAYEVDCFNIDKNGVIAFGDRADRGKIKNLIDKLAERGFECMTQDNAEDTGEDFGLCIEMPKSSFSDTALENLKGLVESKAVLFKKAFGAPTLALVVLEDKVRFPWFPDGTDAEAVKAYTHFVTALCEMAKNQKRVNSTEKPVDNEKYAFRCFLLRLGFIGEEYKAERKILLSKLTGSAAFKNKTAGGANDE
ncbi:virulence protein [Dehalococcoides sp. THU3]|uniref:virulence protein n=1 Tax=Dehalococcoides TaxID=61434 RepID=UPI003218CCD7